MPGFLDLLCPMVISHSLKHFNPQVQQTGEINAKDQENYVMFSVIICYLRRFFYKDFDFRVNQG